MLAFLGLHYKNAFKYFFTRHLTFSLETWCLAVNYLDRFLSVQAVDKECLQVGTGMRRYLSRQVVPGIHRYLKQIGSSMYTQVSQQTSSSRYSQVSQADR